MPLSRDRRKMQARRLERFRILHASAVPIAIGPAFPDRVDRRPA
jgi:hypothetical protein